MKWYNSLTVNQKINLKENSNLLTGMKFQDMRVFFSLPEIIEILYNKLKLEGFDI